MNVNPKRLRLAGLIFFPVFLAALSALSAYGTVRWARTASADTPQGSTGHAWIHRELDLTDGELASISRMEQSYHADRERLLREFDRRIRHLAGLLRTEEGMTEEVKRSIHQVHGVHGSLQEISIVHFFDMIEILPPEKQEKLRSLAARALSEPE